MITVPMRANATKTPVRSAPITTFVFRVAALLVLALLADLFSATVYAQPVGLAELGHLEFLTDSELNKLIELSERTSASWTVPSDVREALELPETGPFKAVVLDIKGNRHSFIRLPGDKTFLFGLDVDGKSIAYKIDRDGTVRRCILKKGDARPEVLPSSEWEPGASALVSLWRRAAKLAK